MRAIAFALLMLAAQSGPRIAEGVAAHDAGRYDEAIAKYQAVLADDPANAPARFELGYSYTAKGDAAQCIATLQPIAGSPTRLQPRMLEAATRVLEHLRRGVAVAGDDTKRINVTVDDHPRIAKLAREKLLEPFAAVALSTLDLEGADAWMKAHAADVSRYRAFAVQQQ